MGGRAIGLIGFIVLSGCGGADTSAPPRSSEPYRPGGLLAETWALDASSERSGEASWRFAPGLEFPGSDASFGDWYGGAGFGGTFRGGLLVLERGTYTLGAAAGDSVRVRLGGETLLDAWRTGEYVQREAQLTLEAGWYDLEVDFERDPTRALLLLTLGRQGMPRRPIPSAQLGYPDAPPPEFEKFDFTSFEAEAIGPWEIRVTATTSVPSILTCGAGGSDDAEVEAPKWLSQFSVTLPAEPASAQRVACMATDPWGRTAEAEESAVSTPAEPVFEPGGLLGEYFQGTNFEFPRMIRLDKIIDIPAIYDGDEGGAFSTPLEADGFSIRWTGGLRVPEAGIYSLHLGADDGQRLWVDGEIVAENWNNHGYEFVTATLELRKGWVPIRLEMFEGGGQGRVGLEWQGPGISRQLVASENLGHDLSALPVKPVAVDALLALALDDGWTRVSWNTNTLATCSLKSGSAVLANRPDPATGFEVWLEPGALELGAEVKVEASAWLDDSSDAEITTTVAPP
jgi:hypothetical protein